MYQPPPSWSGTPWGEQVGGDSWCFGRARLDPSTGMVDPTSVLSSIAMMYRFPPGTSLPLDEILTMPDGSTALNPCNPAKRVCWDALFTTPSITELRERLERLMPEYQQYLAAVDEAHATADPSSGVPRQINRLAQAILSTMQAQNVTGKPVSCADLGGMTAVLEECQSGQPREQEMTMKEAQKLIDQSIRLTLFDLLKDMWIERNVDDKAAAGRLKRMNRLELKEEIARVIDSTLRRRIEAMWNLELSELPEEWII